MSPEQFMAKIASHGGILPALQAGLSLEELSPLDGDPLTLELRSAWGLAEMQYGLLLRTMEQVDEVLSRVGDERPPA